MSGSIGKTSLYRWTIIAAALGLLSLCGIFAASHAASSDGAANSMKATPNQLWTCSMHPQVIREEPGSCPICHMTLTPVKTETQAEPQRDAKPQLSKKREAQSEGAAVTIDPAVVQNMGVRTAVATEGSLRRNVKAVGYLDEAEPNVHEVNLRVSGWIEKLYADTDGMHVKRGDPLFELYSPELQVAIGELINARKSGGMQGSSSSAIRAAATRKLKQLGLSAEQIAALAERDAAPASVTMRSPAAGHVLDKMVVEGSAVKAGDRVMRIVDHSKLWLDAQVFERQAAQVHLGDAMTARFESEPGKTYSGKVIFLHPHVDGDTRTATVRMEIDNAAMTLRPGMFATAKIAAADAPRALLVPREAVIDTGKRQVAFIARGAGTFEPRAVAMGEWGEDGMVEILSGLKAGEEVVTSGQFLLDSESRMQEAIQKYLSEKPQTEASEAMAMRAKDGM